MKNIYTINEVEKTLYNKNGYIVLSDLLLNNEFENLKKNIIEIENYPETYNKWMKYYDPSFSNEKKLVLTRIENFIEYNNFINNFFSSKNFLNLISQLYGGEVLLFKDKYHPKFPGAKGFDAHQDATIWEGMYQIKKFITICIMLESANEENGCLEFANQSLEDKRLIAPSFSKITKKMQEKMKWNEIKSKPGDFIIFSDYSPHRSSNNKSNGSRRSLFITFNGKKFGDKRKIYYEEKRKNYPPNFEREEGKEYIFKA